MLCGCSTARRPAPPATGAVVASPATRSTQSPLTPSQLNPRALLEVDQIDPQVRLNPPATQPAELPEEEALQLFAQAHIARLDGNRALAIELLEKAAAADPGSFFLHDTLGQLYQADAASNDQSIHELEKAAAIEPDHLDLQTNLGRQYLAKNDITTALIYLRLATQTSQYKADDPLSAVTDFFLATALSRGGYDRAALESYQRLANKLRSPTSEFRSHPEASLLLGHLDAIAFEIAELLQKLHRFPEAAAAYHELAASDQGNFELRARECRAWLAAGKPEDAIRAADDCVLRFAANQPSIDLLRETYRAAGKETDAIDAVARLYRQHPTQRPLLYGLSELLRSAGRVDEADRLLAEAAAKYPADTTLLERRMELRRSRGDLPGAARVLIDATAKSPDLASAIAPLWGRIIRPSQSGRLPLTGLRTMNAASASEAARLFWLSRSARVWHRDAAAREALEQATVGKPPFAPAFRDFIDIIWSDPDVDPAVKSDESQKLIERAKAGGNPSLAAELAGLMLLRQGNAADAAQRLAEAVKLGGKSPDLFLARAEALRKAGDARGFETLMWKIISDWPTLPEAYIELYAYYLQERSSPQAQRVLTAWFVNDPQSPTAQEIQAREDFRDGRADAADRLISRLLNQHADDPQVIESVGRYYAQTRRPEEFLKQLEGRRAKEPKNLALSMALAEAYAQGSRNADASRVLDAARAAAADDPDVLYVLSGLYTRIGQKETSEQVLAEILKLEPTHAGACNDLGYSWAEQGKNLPQAEALIRQAIDSEPHNSSFLDSMGWVLYKRGRYAEARGFLDRAIGPPHSPAESEADPVVLDHRGDVLYRLGDRAAAGNDWGRAMEKISTAADREDLRDLRLQLQEKQKQLSAGGPVSVAPAAAGK